MQWADEIRKLQVRTNAETSEETKKALELGAEGIGLCRTEHMFFDDDRISHVRKMLLAENETIRKEAIGTLLGMQKSDFYKIFKLMEDRPVNIRLLDPPLHEFLPETDKSKEIQALASTIGMDENTLKNKIDDTKEVNPMLGTRGCRL
jgi:pyruvate,orthophosphate dikinase